MAKTSNEETCELWNAIAQDWATQVGEHGDINRRVNSDPVLWSFAGNVQGLDVLDAGCGTGYLSRQLAARGARVVGIDFSANMIEIARKSGSSITYRVDSCAELTTISDATIDLIIANYVLMDTPDLNATMAAFGRVLRGRGHVVLVFSHPCFPQGNASSVNGARVYPWEFSYFEERKRVDPPWGHFTHDFIWFHRPLSSYWKAFKLAGFEVVDFEEPHVTADRYDLARSGKDLEELAMRPMSVAFKLRKK